MFFFAVPNSANEMFSTEICKQAICACRNVKHAAHGHPSCSQEGFYPISAKCSWFFMRWTKLLYIHKQFIHQSNVANESIKGFSARLLCMKLVRQKQLRKASLLDTRLYFIISNFHTVLKPQVRVSYDKNFLTLTIYTTFE